MVMFKARDDVNRLYVSRKEGGRGIANFEGSVDVSIQRLKDNREKRGGRQRITTRNNTDDKMSGWTEITRKQTWEEKQCFKRLTSDI